MRTMLNSPRADAAREPAASASTRDGVASRTDPRVDFQSLVSGSPRLVAQRRQHEALLGPALQLRTTSDEQEAPLQALASVALQTPATRAAADGPDTRAANIAVGPATGGPASSRRMAAQRQAVLDMQTSPRVMQQRDRLSATFGPTIIQQARTEAGPSDGLPQPLKAGIESLSGLAMDGVRVHRDSARPASIGALAFAQGHDIHLGPGQDRHLPHEAWHVVQQALGRVPARIQAQGVALNDDPALETEADQMGARAMAAGVDGGPSAPLRAVDASDEAVQRKVGFEFEIGDIETTRQSFNFTDGLHHVPLNKADPLLRGQGFNVEADEATNGSDLEFVTDAFPVTVAGFLALTQALDHIAEIAGYIINQPNVRVNSLFLPHGRSVLNRYARFSGGDPRGTPQATIGLSLGALDALFNEMATQPGAMGPATPTQELFGGGLDPGGAGASMGGTAAATGIAQIGNARNAAHAEAVSVARALPLGVATPELDALVTQLVLYLVTGFDGVQGYGKTIAAPMTMMRTAFDTVFQTLPPVTRNHFENNPVAFVDLVCDAARVLRPAIADNGSVFEGGIYQNPMYGAGGAHPKPLATQQMLTPHLQRDQWLMGIVGGMDLLTSAYFPAGPAEKTEIESLGGYGTKTDQLPGGTRLPILELRGLPKIRYGLFPLMAMDIFRYVFALNNAAAGGNPGDLQALGLPARLAMANDDPAVGRLERQNAIAAAQLAVTAWGVGSGG